MHAKFLKDDSDHRAVMWEVHDQSRWWVVVFHTDKGTYSITNEKMHDVSPTGTLGKKLIATTKV